MNALLRQVLPDAPSAVSACTRRAYTRHNVCYMGNAGRLLQAGFEGSRTISLVMDGARFSNSEVFACFASTPVSKDVAHGMMLPPQVMPEIRVDLKLCKVGIRIQSATDRKMQQGQRQAQNKKEPRQQRPRGDPLVATWHTGLAIHNALQSVIPGGLQEFWPRNTSQPLSELCQKHGCSGRYGLGSQGHCAAVLSEEGKETRHRVTGQLKKSNSHHSLAFLFVGGSRQEQVSDAVGVVEAPAVQYGSDGPSGCIASTEF